MKIELAENLRRLRKENNMTQEELADRINVSVGVVSKWERGASEPELSCLIAIAEVFKVSVDALIGYDLGSDSPQKIIAQLNVLLHDLKLEEALSVADEALLRYPNSLEIVCKAASLYVIVGSEKLCENHKEMCEKAIELYNKAITLLSQDVEHKHSEAELRNDIARCLLTLKKTDEAIRELELNNVCGLNEDMLGLLYINEKRDYDKGLEHIGNSAGMLMTSFIRLVSGAANAYAHMKNYEMAQRICDMYDKVVQDFKIDPDVMSVLDRINAVVHADAGYWFVEKGDREKAREYLTEAYRIAKAYDRSPNKYLDNILLLSELKTDAVAFDDLGPSTLAAIERVLVDEGDNGSLMMWKEICKDYENKGTD